jgi:hypothetical protein
MPPGLTPTPWLIALTSGLCLGAATLSNYLAVFVAGAVLLWLLPRPCAWLATTAGLAIFLPINTWCFLAQRGSREGYFPPFSIIGSLPRLAQYSAANLFGGLPLYVPHRAGTAVAAGLAALVVALISLIALRWHHLGAPRPRLLLALASSAPPTGLLLLGLIFNTTPIELRYLAFATPFVGLLLAGTLSSLPRRWCRGLSGAVLTLQALALLGMMTRQETMQPARATAAAAAALARDGVVVLPRGNDGVGVVGAFINEAPDTLRLSIANQTDTIYQLAARIGGARRVVLALISVDAASRATVELMRAAFTDGPCWRPAGIGFNVRAFDRTCNEDEGVLRRHLADQDRGPARQHPPAAAIWPTQPPR